MRHIINTFHRSPFGPQTSSCHARLVAFVVCVVSLLFSACSFDIAPDGDFSFSDPVLIEPDSPHDDQDVSQPDNESDVHTPDGTSPQDPGRGSIDTGQGWDWDTSDGSSNEFLLEAVFPSTGPVSGGTRIHLQGSQFRSDTRVFVGSTEMAVHLSGSMLVGRTPASTGPGPVTIRVANSNGEVRQLSEAFTYVEALEVSSIVPAVLPTSGGVEVEIRGRGFDQRTAVSFSGRSASRVEVINENLIRAISPEHPQGLSHLRLTTPSQALVLPEALEFFTPLNILRTQPSSGGIEGGDVVEILAHGLTSDTQFFFGGVSAQVLELDVPSQTAIVSTPAHVAGAVDIVSLNRFDSTFHPNAFVYTDTTTPAQIVAAHPPSGPTQGGELVWLVGSGLDDNDISIHFGDHSAEIIESGQGYALISTPPSNMGVVDITVHNSTGEIARLQDGYSYTRNLEIHAVSPAGGEVTGGTSITLEGTGFQGATGVFFGTLRASFTVQSDAEIVATAPAHSVGEVDILVERDDASARFVKGFKYHAPLEIWGFSPSRGAISGGTYVALRGSGFDGLLEVDVNGQKATGVRRLDAHNLYFYTPENPVGQADVVVKTAEQNVNAPYPFVYFNPVSSFGGVWGDPIEGAVNVTVLALGGSPIPNAYVMLSTVSTTEYQGLTNENGQLTLSGPHVIGPQTITATAAGFSSATIHTMDAENITVFLNPLDAEGGSGAGNMPPFGTIRGKVKTLGKLSSPHDQTTIDMAMVRTTQKYLYGGNPAPGARSIVIDDSPYELRSRVGDVAVVALCGTYHGPSETFTPQYIGIQRYVVVADRGNHTADIDCTIPLNDSITIKIVNPIYSPDGPNQNVVNVYWDFGFEGMFPSPTTATGLSDVLSVNRQPSLDEPALSGMTYTIVGGSYTGQSTPYSQTQKTGVTDISSLITLPPLLDVPQPFIPAAGGLVKDGVIYFHANGPHYPDFYRVTLINYDGITVWELIIPGTETSVVLPQFPDFSFLPAAQRPSPVSLGPVYLVIYGIRIPNFSYESVTYRDFSADRWEAFSVTHWTVQMSLY